MQAAHQLARVGQVGWVAVASLVQVVQAARAPRVAVPGRQATTRRTPAWRWPPRAQARRLAAILARAHSRTYPIDVGCVALVYVPMWGATTTATTAHAIPSPAAQRNACANKGTWDPTAPCWSATFVSLTSGAPPAARRSHAPCWTPASPPPRQACVPRTPALPPPPASACAPTPKAATAPSPPARLCASATVCSAPPW